MLAYQVQSPVGTLISYRCYYIAQQKSGFNMVGSLKDMFSSQNAYNQRTRGISDNVIQNKNNDVRAETFSTCM